MHIEFAMQNLGWNVWVLAKMSNCWINLLKGMCIRL